MKPALLRIALANCGLTPSPTLLVHPRCLSQLPPPSAFPAPPPSLHLPSFPLQASTDFPNTKYSMTVSSHTVIIASFNNVSESDQRSPSSISSFHSSQWAL